MSFIGTWKDDIRVDQEAVKAYVGGEFAPNGGAHADGDWGAFDIDKEVISLLFQIQFMKMSGFSPEFETCYKCQTNIDDIDTQNVKFDFKEGRMICLKCDNNRSKYGMTVTKGTLKQLFWINHSDVQRVDRIKFSKYAVKQGEALLEAFIPFHMGREFKSLKFLRQLRQGR